MVLVDSPNTLLLYSRRPTNIQNRSNDSRDKKGESEEDMCEANVREDSPHQNYMANMNDERLGNQ